MIMSRKHYTPYPTILAAALALGVSCPCPACSARPQQHRAVGATLQSSGGGLPLNTTGVLSKPSAAR